MLLTRTLSLVDILSVSILVQFIQSVGIEFALLLFLDPANEMRFNKQEMITLAQQPSNRFDKEGLLFVRERQEGFFRRTESEYYLVVVYF